MVEHTEKIQDPFLRNLQRLTVDASGFLDTIAKKVQDAVVKNAAENLKKELSVISALPRGFKEINQQLQAVRRTYSNSFSTPPDLSGIYRIVRETFTRTDNRGNTVPLLFGDIVDTAINQIYSVQNPGRYSLLSQFIYLYAYSRALFPEVPDAPFWTSTMKREKTPMRKGTPQLRTTRMLQEDFNLLAMMRLASDYFNTEVAKLQSSSADLKTAEDAVYYLSPFTLIHDHLDKIKGTQFDKELLRGHADGRIVIPRIAHLIGEQRYSGIRNRVIFYSSNREAMDSLEDVGWEQIKVAREVPSAQKTFFEENKGPLLVCVDAAPGKTYMAVVTITTAKDYFELERQKGSAVAARESTVPLRKPFNESAYLASGNIAFFVRKDDGELYFYGDSNTIARIQLGEHYDRCKKFVRHILYNLTHATYITGSAESPVPSGPRKIPTHKEPIIPERPTVREIPSPERGQALGEYSLQSRVAHTRLLPAGWYPSFQGWTKARKSGQLDLYAVFEEPDVSSETRFRQMKLDLKNTDFKAFRAGLEKLRKKHGDRVRFQTYVSETKSD